MILVANDRFVFHFNHDHVFQANRIDLAGGIIVYKDILTTQAYMTANATNAAFIRGEECAVLLPITVAFIMISIFLANSGRCARISARMVSTFQINMPLFQT